MSGTISQTTHNNSSTCTGVELYLNISTDDTQLYILSQQVATTQRHECLSVVYRKDRIWQKKKQHHNGFLPVVEALIVGKVKN